MEPGFGARRYAWAKARRDLLPVLPLPVVRRRVARAKEIGLDYRVYATVRAATGRDIIGFLFSSNALRMHRALQEMPAARAEALRQVQDCQRIGMLHAPLPLDLEGLPLDAAHRAPGFTASAAVERDMIRAALAPQKLPGDGVLVIGATSVERGWSAGARLAGYLDESRFFKA
jgi:hypothetical protein